MQPSQVLVLGLVLLVLRRGDAAFDYGLALTKSLLYFEAQRSGRLPTDQRVQWRDDSALTDGNDANIDLTGGYYDAGDNVKFGFPMAFTITLLSWGAVEFYSELDSRNELDNVRAAIRWGTEYLLKAHPEPNVLYVQVGNGDADHACWERPEDMTTPRTTYKIDAEHPGSDLAAETSAALAAASLVLYITDAKYANVLLAHAKQLFEFALNDRGVYSDSVPQAKNFYSSSGYDDELLWAAAWLLRVTEDTEEAVYSDFLHNAQNKGGTRTQFSWDDKFAGVQVLVSKLIMDGVIKLDETWETYTRSSVQFICNVLQKGSSNTKLSPGGVLWFQPWNNLQYTTAASLLIAAHASHLLEANSTLQCSDEIVTPDDLLSFVRRQADYILGANPKNMSYMVGFGPNYPKHVHHRAASIISYKKDKTPISCQTGFDKYYNPSTPDPNVLDGAIVGGPDASDSYTDARTNFQQSEPATINTAPFVGVLAKLASVFLS